MSVEQTPPPAPVAAPTGPCVDVLCVALFLCAQAPPGSSPDVWVQLLAECTRDSEAQPAVKGPQQQQQQQHHNLELAGARAESAGLRVWVEALEGQVAAASEAAAAAAVAEAAAAAAEAASESAELRGRLQALEEQLQEVLAALQRQPRQA